MAVTGKHIEASAPNTIFAFNLLPLEPFGKLRVI